MSCRLRGGRRARSKAAAAQGRGPRRCGREGEALCGRAHGRRSPTRERGRARCGRACVAPARRACCRAHARTLTRSVSAAIWAERHRGPARVLVTGASGFIGRFLVRPQPRASRPGLSGLIVLARARQVAELVQRLPSATILCLQRDSSPAVAHARLLAALVRLRHRVAARPPPRSLRAQATTPLAPNSPT